MSGLPKGWVEATLEDLCEFNPKHDPETDRGTTVSFIPMPAVDDETGAIVDRSAIRPLSEVWKGYTHFANADVIFAKITPCMENGKIAVARDLENGMACGSTEFHVLRSKGAVEPDFVWRFLRQRSYRQIAERSMTGAVGQRRVPKPFLEGTTLPLPPLAEQKRIVAKLDALDAKSARARTELARIETLVSRYKQAVLSKAFSGELVGLVPAATEKPHDLCWDLPLGWRWVAFGDAVEIASNLVNPDTIPELPHIAPDNIESGTARLLPFKTIGEDGVISAKHRFFSGQILYSKIRPYLRKAVIANFDGACSADMYPLSPRDVLSARYLLQWLVSEQFTHFAVEHQGRTVLPKINQTALNKTPLPLPPLATQHEIVRRIESAFAKIDRLAKEAKRALELVGRLDEAILAKAFRGELVPQNENDEPAEHLLARIRAERDKAPKARRGRQAKS